MDLMTALAAASQAVSLVKDLNEINDQFDRAEWKAKSAELLSTVADLKIAVIEANDDAREKQNEIGQLKDAFQLKVETVRHGDFAFEKSIKTGTPVGHAFCPRCEQVDGFMIKITYAGGQMGNMACPKCKTKYFNVFPWNEE